MEHVRDIAKACKKQVRKRDDIKCTFKSMWKRIELNIFCTLSHNCYAQCLYLQLFFSLYFRFDFDNAIDLDFRSDKNDWIFYIGISI